MAGGFHNPFSAKPDWGGGISELGSQIMQLLMALRMGRTDEENQQRQGNKDVRIARRESRGVPGRKETPWGPLGQASPGAQAPSMPQMAQMAQMPQMPPPQTGMQGQMMGPGGPGGAPQQRPASVPSMAGAQPQNIQSIMQALPPHLQQVLIGLLQSGTFKEPKPPGQAGQAGQQPRR